VAFRGRLAGERALLTEPAEDELHAVSRVVDLDVALLRLPTRRVRSHRDRADRDGALGVAAGADGRRAAEGDVELLPARRPVRLRDVVGDLPDACGLAAARLPGGPGRRRRRFGLREQDDERADTDARNECQKHVDGGEAPAVRAPTRAAGGALVRGGVALRGPLGQLGLDQRRLLDALAHAASISFGPWRRWPDEIEKNGGGQVASSS
jgi:hypothetical protein